jgi:glycosyltransferase involved in cell wall biosynthesis
VVIKVLYFSVNEWGNMGRRKPRLAHEFAQQPEVTSVLYVEPAVSTSFLDLMRGRLDSGHLGHNRRAHLRALLGRPRLVDENVWIYTGSTKTIPLSRFEALRKVRALHQINHALYVGPIRHRLASLPGDRLIVWLTHPLQAHALDDFPQRTLLCYDWTDDWAEFDLLPVEDRQDLVDWNEHILREADLVFAVSESLYHRAKAINEHSYRAPNATDTEKLGGAASDGPVAPELVGLSRPIIGYVGQIADKMDYGLIDQLARARPTWSFVFVGPVWSSKQEQVASLKELGNIHFLGARPFEQLAPYLRGFDVCTLPHAITPLTRSMDPIKLYDYLSTGKPIVSTPVAGVERFADVVYVSDTPSAFLEGLEEALTENSDLHQKRLAYAQQNAWSQRAREMWQVLKHHLEKI